MSTPDDISGQLQHASALCGLGRFSEAAQVLHQVISRAPEIGHAWSMLAAAELGAGNPEPALKAAENAIGLQPDAEWPHRIASAALRRLDRHEESIGHAREAVRLEPNSWPTLTTLARALAASSSDLPEAHSLAARALELAPENPETHVVAGTVAAADGNRAEAEEAFRTALSIDPQNTAAHNELARMRMGGRHHTNPAGLADAASGFATAVRTDPTAQVARRNLEHVLRVFLSKTAYFVFLDAYILARLSSSSSQGSARLIPVIALVLPAGYAWRFTSGLDQTLRTYLITLITREHQVRLAVALESLAVACLLATALAPQSARTGLAAAGACAALVSRLMLYSQTRHTGAAAHGRQAAPAIGTTTMWLIAVSLLLAAGVFILATQNAGAGSGGFVAAALCAVASGAVIHRIRRRSTANRLTTNRQP